MEIAIDSAEIVARYGHVCERIRVAARRAGRDPDAITLVVVTKTFPLGAIRAALGAGARDIGENYVQEAARKMEALAADPPDRAGMSLRWHFVGQLQRNKAARAVRLFDVIHSIDSIQLAEHLDRAAAACGKIIPVLLEVNVSNECTKGGIGEAAAAALLTALASLKHLRVEGMMTIPPPPQYPDESRPYFRALAKLRTGLASRGFDLPHLSMGMTDDYEIAIEEGATMVRVGRAIFGRRT